MPTVRKRSFRVARAMAMAGSALALSAVGMVASAAPSAAVNTGPPVVTSVAPARGGIGTKVVVIGTNLYRPTAVDFGGIPASRFTSNTLGTMATVYAPTSTVAGAVDITVTTSMGISATSTADQFTYLAPVLTTMSPAKGTFRGGTTVTLTGVALGGATGVMFGGNPAAHFVVVGPSKISAVTPAYTPNTTSCCTAAVSVTTPLGTNPTGPKFTYGSWPTQAYTGTLAGVSCGGSSACVAAGVAQNTYGKRSLYEQWTGTNFTAMPGSLTASTPLGVSCPAAGPTSCVAVGGAGNSLLVEHDTATGWMAQSAPKPAGAAYSALAGVSCTSDGFCMAAGGAGASSTSTSALTEALESGTWVIVPNSLGQLAGGVSCTSSQYCVALGGYLSLAIGAGIVPTGAVWNGSAWTEDDPAFSTANSVLTSVSCTGPGACIAVGANESCSLSCPPAPTPLIEQLSGTTWSVMSAPSVSGELVSVSCSDANDCMAVGQSGSSPLIESWDGSSWTVVSAATPTGETTAELSGVSCTAPSNCMAVGQWTQTYVEIIGVKSDTLTHALAESWNGSTWAVVPTVDS